MRNVFLTLILANLLLFAWQAWVDPAPPAPSKLDSSGLALFTDPSVAALAPLADSWPAGAAAEPAATLAPGNCQRIGPLPDNAAAQQVTERLASRGIEAALIARDTQIWLGHWVQIGNFASLEAAERARQRLKTGGISDAYLMQDGTQPIISLGVFRERDRADRVAGAARSLGFVVGMRDRYRPTVEQWLLIRPRPEQILEPEALSLAGDRIMRIEPAACEPAENPQPPAAAAAEERK